MDKSFLWFLFPTLLQTIVGVGVMVSDHHLLPRSRRYRHVAILTALALSVTPLASTGDNWVLSTHWHATSESGRKELLFNLLLANLGMKTLWVGIFWLLSPLVLAASHYETIAPSISSTFGLALVGLLAGTFWGTLSSLMVIERAPVSHALNESLQWGAGAMTTLLGLSVAKIGVLSLFLAPIAAGPCLCRAWALVCGPQALSAAQFALGQGNRSERHAGDSIQPDGRDCQQPGSLRHPAMAGSLDVGYLCPFTKLSRDVRDRDEGLLEDHDAHVSGIVCRRSRPAARQVEETVSLWYLCVTAGGILVTLFSPEVIHILTHGKFDQAAALVPIWFLLYFAHSMAIPFTQYLLTVRQNFLLSWSSIVISLGTMGLVCVATWQFGVIGATSAAVFGAFALHGMRFYLARRLGCSYRIEAGMVWGIAVVVTSYIISRVVEIPLPVKVVLGLLVVGLTMQQIMRRVSIHDVLTVLMPSK